MIHPLDIGDFELRNIRSSGRRKLVLKRKGRIFILGILLIAVAVGGVFFVKYAKEEKGKRLEAEAIAAAEEKARAEEARRIALEEKKRKEMEEAIAAVTPPAPEEIIPTELGTPLASKELLPEEDLLSAYNGALVMGDSRIEGFRLYSGVGNADYFCTKSLTVNRILDGSQININGGNRSVYDLLDNNTYEKIIIGVGLNELGWLNLDIFVEDYGKLIDAIKERQPAANIYIHAVLPVSKEKNDRETTFTNIRIAQQNESLIKLADSKGVKFVNPSAVMIDQGGFLIPAASRDGVHLSAEYCKIWANQLAELL